MGAAAVARTERVMIEFPKSRIEARQKAKLKSDRQLAEGYAV
jgi:hypothetical protein